MSQMKDNILEEQQLENETLDLTLGMDDLGEYFKAKDPNHTPQRCPTWNEWNDDPREAYINNQKGAW